MSILGNKYPLLPIALIAVIAVAAGCGEEETTTSTNAAPEAPVAAVPMSNFSGPGSHWYLMTVLTRSRTARWPAWTPICR